MYNEGECSATIRSFHEVPYVVAYDVHLERISCSCGTTLQEEEREMDEVGIHLNGQR